MGVMIQVRNVPEALHVAIKARAAAEGLTLTDYIQRLLEREVAQPTRREILERLRRVPRVKIEPSAAALIRQERDSR
jgi:plasmid stability protein